MMKRIIPYLMITTLAVAASINVTIQNANAPRVLDALNWIQGRSLQLAVADGDRTVVSFDCPVFQDPNVSPDETKAEYGERLMYELLRQVVHVSEKHKQKVENRLAAEAVIEIIEPNLIIGL